MHRMNTNVDDDHEFILAISRNVVCRHLKFLVLSLSQVYKIYTYTSRDRSPILTDCVDKH